MVDTTDSKSAARKRVCVQVSQPVYKLNENSAFFILNLGSREWVAVRRRTVRVLESASGKTRVNIYAVNVILQVSQPVKTKRAVER